ncbi:MAG TPA: hypothetical protein ENN28_01705 [Candidatus Uhrbacteria bacterium]|nr:hypothetical protein [Candidatus Uhrbacteria bacterium]
MGRIYRISSRELSPEKTQQIVASHCGDMGQIVETDEQGVKAELSHEQARFFVSKGFKVQIVLRLSNNPGA